MPANRSAEERWPAVVGTELAATAFAVAAAGCGLRANVWDRYGEIAEITAAGLEFWVWLPAAVSAVTAGTLWWLIVARRRAARVGVGAAVGALTAGLSLMITVALAHWLIGRGLVDNPKEVPEFAPFSLLLRVGMLTVLAGLGGAAGAALGRLQEKLFAGQHKLRTWRKVRIALAVTWVLSGPLIYTYGQLLPAIRGLWVRTDRATAERLKVGMSLQYATVIIGGPPGDYRIRPRPPALVPRGEPKLSPVESQVSWITDRGRITVVTGYILIFGAVDGVEPHRPPQGYVREIRWEPAEPSDPTQLAWPVLVRVTLAVFPLAAWWVVSRRRFAAEVHPN